MGGRFAPSKKRLPAHAAAAPTRDPAAGLQRPSAAASILLGLILCGLALRVIASVSWWPTTIQLQDSYQIYAGYNPFADPQHPAGYPLILGAIGALTRQVQNTVLLQHVVGVCAALLYWAATRRVTGARWAGLLPAAVVLLNPDEIYVEHAVLSESWALLFTAAGLYAAVRVFDDPAPWWRWPLLTGVAMGLAVTIRSSALPVIAVTLLALILIRPRPFRTLRREWRAPAAAAGAAAVVLLAFALGNAAWGPRFEVAPSPGWYLYGRVAQFADCSRFTPPAGTLGLCQTTPPSTRPGSTFYTIDPKSPAARLFGGLGRNDALVGDWARRAARAQPGDFLRTAWTYLWAYYVPSSIRPQLGSALDPQLDFTYDNVYFKDINHRLLERFYAPFEVHTDEGGLRFLHDLQRVIRFGGTALSITTLLTLLGLFIGTRRSRVGVLLFGVGGLSMILAPALTGTYVGRYSLPMAGPLTAAAALTLTELWRVLAARRPRERRPEVGAGTP